MSAVELEELGKGGFDFGAVFGCVGEVCEAEERGAGEALQVQLVFIPGEPRELGENMGLFYWEISLHFPVSNRVWRDPCGRAPHSSTASALILA